MSPWSISDTRFDPSEGGGRFKEVLGNEARTAAVIGQVLAHASLGFDGPQQVQAILIWHGLNVIFESGV